MTYDASGSPPLSEPAESSSAVLANIRRCILTRRGLRTEPGDLRALIARLDAAEVRRLEDYNLYFVNLLSLLGDDLPAAAIDDLAVACTTRRLRRRWEGNRHVVGLGDAARAPILEGWDVSLLSEVVRQRGLVIATAHIGSYRMLSRELTAMGFDVFIALDQVSARHRSRHEALSRDAAIPARGRLHVCDVESTATTAITLIKALRRKQVVLFFVDGNMGIDGAIGGHNRCRVRFMNQLLAVKYGAPYLASAAGAALLEVFPADQEDGRLSVVHGRLTTLPRDLDEEQRRQAAANWTQAFYASLESYFRERPGDWEGVRFLHRWRVMPEAPAEPRPQELSQAGDHLLGALQAGQILRVDRQLVAPLHHEGGKVLCDVRSLRSYRLGASTARVADRLTSPSGLTYRDVADISHHHEGLFTVMSVLARLYCSGALTVAPG